MGKIYKICKKKIDTLWLKIFIIVSWEDYFIVKVSLLLKEKKKSFAKRWRKLLNYTVWNDNNVFNIVCGPKMFIYLFFYNNIWYYGKAIVAMMKICSSILLIHRGKCIKRVVDVI